MLGPCDLFLCRNVRVHVEATKNRRTNLGFVFTRVVVFQFLFLIVHLKHLLQFGHPQSRLQGISLHGVFFFFSDSCPSSLLAAAFFSSLRSSFVILSSTLVFL